jgi:tetratricopeptide (TPR) repeat protein
MIEIKKLTNSQFINQLSGCLIVIAKCIRTFHLNNEMIDSNYQSIPFNCYETKLNKLLKSDSLIYNLAMTKNVDDFANINIIFDQIIDMKYKYEIISDESTIRIIDRQLTVNDLRNFMKRILQVEPSIENLIDKVLKEQEYADKQIKVRHFVKSFPEPYFRRKNLLNEMKQVLFEKNSMLILNGPPGVGKSSMARYFSHKYYLKNPFKLARELNVESAAKFFNSLKQILVDANIETEIFSIDHLILEVYRVLDKILISKDVLLIFDNLQFFLPDQLLKFIYGLPKEVKLILTTRSEMKIFDAYIIKLNKFTMDEFSTYFKIIFHKQRNLVISDQSMTIMFNILNNYDKITPFLLNKSIALMKIDREAELGGLMQRLEANTKKVLTLDLYEDFIHMDTCPKYRALTRKILFNLAFLDYEKINVNFLLDLIQVEKSMMHVFDEILCTFDELKLIKLTNNKHSIEIYSIYQFEIRNFIFKKEYEDLEVTQKILRYLFNLKSAEMLNHVILFKNTQLLKDYSNLESILCKLYEKCAKYCEREIFDFNEALDFNQKMIEIRKKIYKENPKSDREKSKYEQAIILEQIGDIYLKLHESKLTPLDTGFKFKFDNEENETNKIVNVLEILKERRLSIMPSNANIINCISNPTNNTNINKKSTLKRLSDSRRIFHIRTLISHQNIADNSSQSNSNLRKALDSYTESLAMLKKIFMNRDSEISANLHDKIASINEKMNENNIQKAFDIYEEAYYMRRRIFDSNPSSDLKLAKSYDNMGNMYQKLYEYDKAQIYYMKSLEIREKFYKNLPHADLAVSYSNVANAYSKMTLYRRALDYHKRAYDVKKQLYQNFHPDLVVSLERIAKMYTKLEEPTQALNHYLDCLEMRSIFSEERDLKRAFLLHEIGVTYLELKDYKKSLEFSTKSFEILTDLFKIDQDLLCVVLFDIAYSYFKLENYVESLECFSESYNISRRLFDASSSLSESADYDSAVTLFHVGKCYFKLYDHSNALECFMNSLGYFVSIEDKLYSQMLINSIRRIHEKLWNKETIITWMEIFKLNPYIRLLMKLNDGSDLVIVNRMDDGLFYQNLLNNKYDLSKVTLRGMKNFKNCLHTFFD